IELPGRKRQDLAVVSDDVAAGPHTELVSVSDINAGIGCGRRQKMSIGALATSNIQYFALHRRYCTLEELVDRLDLQIYQAANGKEDASRQGRIISDGDRLEFFMPVHSQML